MRKLNFGLPFAALLVFGMVFTACQKDNVLTEASKQNRFFGVSGPLSWNDACAGDDLVLTLVGTGNKQIQQLIAGDWVQIAAVSGGSDPLVATLENVAAGTYEFRYKVGSGGFSASVFVVVENCCQDAFTADLDCSGDPKVLTVTFTAEEAGDYVIQGGLTNGTTIESMVADQGFEMIAGHPAVVNSNANVTRWEGSLDACETVTIIIEYTGGAGVGSWSAKSVVDGVEVTNGESDDQDCP
jgi:hypothetical protein